MQQRRARTIGRAFGLFAPALGLIAGCAGSSTTPVSGAGGTSGGAGAGAIDGGAGGTSRDGGAGGQSAGDAAVSACSANVTAQILANQSVVLAGDSCADVPAGSTQYDGVISGAGTLRFRALGGAGTLILTADSTFALPPSQQTETATETKSPTDPNHVHYFSIATPNPPAVFVEPGVTLQLGTSSSTTGTIGSYIPNTNGTTINLDNMQIDGTLALPSGPVQRLGIISGTGVITRPAVGTTGGTLFMVGDNPFSGVYSQFFGGYFGSDHVLFSLPNATIFSNESFIVAAPEGQFGATATHLLTFPQTIWESHYGDDINTNSGRIVFAGVYSYSNSGDPLNPSLSDPRLNTMLVQNVAGSPTGGNNSSFRGINIEGGTTEWGDGTTATFFLPAAPSPAAPDSTVKNAYINLHNGATLVFNYNSRYTCDVGITGGGGGPRADGSVGAGNLTIAGTAGNDAVLTMPQNYNGITTIGAGATLQLGSGAPVQATRATVGAPTTAEPHGAVTGTAMVASYSGDSSLLIAESPAGAATDAIVNDGRLLVNNTTTAITLSHVSGAGTVTQIGPASLTLMTNTYRGGTEIRGGILFAGDDHALGSGDVDNRGTLAAAPGQRTINVRGGYRQGAGGVLRLDGRRGGVVLRIAGRADLGGQLRLPARGITVGRRTAMIRAAGGLHGRFRSIVAGDREVAVSYDGTTCYVTPLPSKKHPAAPPLVATAGIERASTRSGGRRRGRLCDRLAGRQSLITAGNPPAEDSAMPIRHAAFLLAAFSIGAVACVGAESVPDAGGQTDGNRRTRPGGRRRHWRQRQRRQHRDGGRHRQRRGRQHDGDRRHDRHRRRVRRNSAARRDAPS